MKIFFFLLMIISVLSHNLRDDPYTKLSNVRYGSFERNYMDVYIPKAKSPTGTYGAMLLIHGGGWTAGDKTDVESFCKGFAKMGYITAGMNYRYVDYDKNITYREELEDIENAIKKLVQICVPLRYTISGLAIGGASAGAHLTGLFAYSIPQKSPIQIKFIVNMVGPSDLHDDKWKGSSISENAGTTITLLINAIKKGSREITPEELEDMMKKGSPVSYINSNSVPTICAYGGKDTIVPAGNRDATINTLKAAGVKYDFFDFVNSDHYLQDDPDVLIAMVEKMGEYAKTYFGY